MNLLEQSSTPAPLQQPWSNNDAAGGASVNVEEIKFEDKLSGFQGAVGLAITITYGFELCAEKRVYILYY